VTLQAVLALGLLPRELPKTSAGPNPGSPEPPQSTKLPAFTRSVREASPLQICNGVASVRFGSNLAVRRRGLECRKRGMKTSSRRTCRTPVIGSRNGPSPGRALTGKMRRFRTPSEIDIAIELTRRRIRRQLMMLIPVQSAFVVADTRALALPRSRWVVWCRRFTRGAHWLR
jgi:hypothetical protein